MSESASFPDGEPVNTYDDQVNDYLRAVEQALDGVPASRRDKLLADLSDHIAAKLAETRAGTRADTRAGTRAAPPPAQDPREAEVRSVLDLLGDPADVAAELRADDDTDAAGDGADTDSAAGTGPLPPIEITPGRKVGALIWVLITIATVSLLCVGVVLAGVLLFFAGR